VFRLSRRRLGIAVAVTAAVIAAGLFASQGVAEAGVSYTTKTGKIPVGGGGRPEPGGGARIANKAYGYYVGRVMPGGKFVRTGGRSGHEFGRITGPGVDMCGWLHRSGIRRAGHAKSSCSRAVSNRMWQRASFGTHFSAVAGQKGHNGTPVAADKHCSLYYNYFTNSSMQTGKLRNRARGHLGASRRAKGKVNYRYQTLDGKAVVVFDPTLGWGFTQPGCVNLTGVQVFDDADTGSPPPFEHGA
jgi:hypothetical protein